MSTKRDEEKDLTPSSLNGADRRRRAEEKAPATGGQSLGALSPEEGGRLLHELQVHQIELEMQNEELRRTQEGLESSRARYLDLYDLAPAGYVTLSEHSSILEANLTFATLLGLPKSSLIKSALTRYILSDDQDTFYRHRKRLFETGEPQVFDIRVLRSDGGRLWVRMEARAAKDGENGEPICRAVMSDITARKREEDELEKALARARQRESEMGFLLEASQSVLQCHSFEESARRIFDICRKATGAVSGYVALLSANGEENEVLFLESGGMPCKVDHRLPMPIRGLRAEAYGKKEVVYENDFMKSRWARLMPPGHVRMRNVMFAPLTLGGKVLGVIGLANKPTDFTEDDARMAAAFGDISAIALDRARAEEALCRSEEKFSLAFQISPHLVTISRASDGAYLEVNDAFTSITGFTREEALASSAVDLCLWADIEERKRVVSELLDGSAILEREFLFRRKNGETFIGVFSAKIFRPDDQRLILSIMSDITERKMAEEQLRHSEEDLNRAQAVAQTGSWRLNVRRNELRWSNESYRIFGIANGTPMTYETFLAAVHPADKELVDLKWRAALCGEPYDIEHRILVGGKLKWVHEKAELEFDDLGKLLGGFGSVQDITERKQAEEAVEKARKALEWERNLLQSIIDSARNSHLVYLDRGFNFVHVNEVYAKACGYGPGEMIGKRYFALFPHEKNEAIFAGVRDSGIPVEFHDKPFVFPDQPERGITYWDWTLTPVKDPSGNAEGLVLSLFETTKRKEAEEAMKESEANLSRAQSMSRLANWEMDVTTDKVRGSHELYRIFNLEADFTLDSYVEKFHPDDRAYVVESIHAAIYERKPYNMDYRIIPRADEIRHVHAEGEVTHDETGVPMKFFGTVQDITERKEMEGKIRRAKDELEYRVQERTKELAQRNKDLENFTFVAAHHLQEPLRKIQLFADLFTMKYEAALQEEGKDYLHRMQETASRMRDLLQALLEYSRLIAEAEPFTRVSLNEIAREVVSGLEAQIRDSGATVHIGGLPEIDADGRQLFSLFHHLIANGVKFRREGEIPLVKVYADCSVESKSGACEIIVEDNGIGFDEEYRNRIFMPFQRLHGTSEYLGVGMGLTICKRVLERHNGAIRVKSTPGRGSAFILSLPMRQNQSTNDLQ